MTTQDHETKAKFVPGEHRRAESPCEFGPRTEERAISQAFVSSLCMPALSLPQRWTGEEAKYRQDSAL